LGGQQALVDSYLSFTMALAALVVAVYLVQSLLRMRGEETAYRAEPVLATPVGRLRWAASHVTVAVLGAAWLLVLMGLFAGLGRGGDDVGHQIGRLLGAALAQLPAALVLAGITIALIGLLPRWSVAAWGLLGLFVAIGQFGDLLKLNQRVRDISPFTHTPTVLGGTVSATPLIVLSLVAIALAAIGLLGLRRRDIGAA
jgi:ABC-2 type transport system permease protein